MTVDDASAAASDSAAVSTSRRDLAVARSLASARARNEQRVQRFLDAAFELMASSESMDFTVQQVVDQSGQSLRSFYQYFKGKYELLLTVFEEAVRWTAEHLGDVVAEETDPLARVHAFVVEYHRLCVPPPPGSRAVDDRPQPAVMAEFAQQLLTQHPREAAAAFGPLVDLLDQLLADAAAAGAVRPDLDHRRIAGVILEAVMFNVFASTISGSPVRDGGDEVFWDLVMHGIAPDE